MKTACFVCSPTVSPGSRTAGLLSSPNKPQDVDDTHVGLVRQRAVTAASMLCSSKQDVRQPVGLRLCCRCCAWVRCDGASPVNGSDALRRLTDTFRLLEAALFHLTQIQRSLCHNLSQTVFPSQFAC